jgi:subtilase family serine protease
MMPTIRLAELAFLIGIILLVPVRAQEIRLTPTDIRAAYDVNPLLESGYTGKGVTVGIVGMGNPGQTLFSDLARFNREYRLPNSTISTMLLYGSGGGNLFEITGDVELVHAMAPDAKILLVLTGPAPHKPLDGFSYVIEHDAADIATMSFYQPLVDNGTGAADETRSYDVEFAKSIVKNITLISISNDWGSNNTIPWVNVNGEFWTKYLPNAYLMPEYSPYVTIVGGTALTMKSGGYVGEIGWNQSGGGPSNLFQEPNWQTGPGVPSNGFRNTPDIALDASCATPYAIVWNSTDSWFCGTSAAAPTFAGIIADIEQAAGKRLGFLNPALYSLAVRDPSVYHDVTSGCSLVRPDWNSSSTQTGYCASPGWDFVTGWGSIDAARLAKYLAPNVKIEIPTSIPWTAPYVLVILIIGLVTVVAYMRRKRRSKTWQP